VGSWREASIEVASFELRVPRGEGVSSFELRGVGWAERTLSRRGTADLALGGRCGRGSCKVGVVGFGFRVARGERGAKLGP
jgi:hypothetical protein